jgi:Circularly permutated YpsA SLOG family
MTDRDNSIMLDGIISGGQSGAEHAARRAAVACGIPIGGCTSAGSTREGGPPLEIPRRHEAAAMLPETGPTPTELNVRGADATLWFGDTTTAAAQATVGACHRLGRPCMPIYPAAKFQPSHVTTWITENGVRTLNVAGNCEEEEPGIGDRVERFLREVLLHLGHERPPACHEAEET